MKSLSDNIKPLLAIIVTVAGFSYFYMCSIRNIKPDPQILIAIVGSVGTCLGYYFGASSSKAEQKSSVNVPGDSPTVNVNSTPDNKPPQE